MKKVRIAVLAYRDCMPTQLFAIADVLRIAADIHAGLGHRGGVTVDVELVQLARKVAVAGGTGLALQRPSGHYGVLIIPGLAAQRRDQDWDATLAPLASELAFIRHSFARGTAVASVCTGAFLLGEAGLLDGRHVTTAWLFGAGLAARYPSARVNADAMLLEDGAVITTAAVSSAFDLATFLVKRHFGVDVAAAVAAVMLLPGQRVSQAPYVDAGLAARRLPTFSENLVQWFARRLADEYDLDGIAQAFHVSGRTLLRRVKAETGKTPLALLQEARVEAAQRMLKASGWSIARIVEAVGYTDVVSFARLFAKQVGETPAKYRRRHAPAANTA